MASAAPPPASWDEIRDWDAPPAEPPPSASAHLQHHHHGMPIHDDPMDHPDYAKYPPVKSPWLSRWAGLGYGQVCI